MVFPAQTERGCSAGIGISATEDAVGYWADSAVFLFATAFFSLVMSGDWKTPRWMWPAILHYGPDLTCYTEESHAGYDVPPLPDPGDIGMVVRFNLVKNELVGYYEGTSIPAERTTIEVEIISLPSRRIVAKKSFLGHPWHSINAGLEIDRVDGADEAIKQGHSWLDSLFAQPDSSQDGGTEPPPARSEQVRSPGP